MFSILVKCARMNLIGGDKFDKMKIHGIIPNLRKGSESWILQKLIQNMRSILL